MTHTPDKHQIEKKPTGKEVHQIEVTGDELAIIRRAVEYFRDNSEYCNEKHEANDNGWVSFYESDFKEICNQYLHKDFQRMIKGLKPIATIKIG